MDTISEELIDAIRQVVREEVAGIKQDVSGLKQGVSGLKEDVSALKQDFSGLKQEVSELNRRMDRFEVQQKENTAILRALEHKADVHKAGMDKLTHEVAEIKGELKELKSDISLANTVAAKNRFDIEKMKGLVGS